MENFTLTLSLVAAFAAFLLKPHRALVVFSALLLAYPLAMTVRIGNVDFNAPRIVVLGLLANGLRTKRARDFKWNLLDTAVISVWFFQTMSIFTNVPSDIVIVRQGGAFFDTILPYLAVRMCIRDRQEFLGWLRGMFWIAVPLTVLALYETKTGYDPYWVLHKYFGWGFQLETERPLMRAGLYRATGSFGEAILLGLYFSAVSTLMICFWKEKTHSTFKVLVCYAIVFAGVIASMSSAPLFSTVIGLAMIAAFPYRRYWPAFTICVIAMLVCMELYSSRHFYGVLTRFAFSGETAYYRIGLFDETFGGGMNGHWLTGFGYVGIGPGNDNTHFTWVHQDLVNIYIAMLACFGLVGVLPFMVANFMYYRKLYIAAHLAKTVPDQWLIWCFSATLAGWNIAMLTISSFRQITILLYMFIAIANDMPGIMARAAVPVGNTLAEYITRQRRRVTPMRGAWQYDPRLARLQKVVAARKGSVKPAA